MNPNTCLVVDAWEGNDIDATMLKDNGVGAVILRLNDMNGGHHLDKRFTEAWTEAGEAGIVRAPYFVYNPWATSLENFNWLKANKPVNTNTIAIDIEVIKSGYSPRVYSENIVDFLDRCDHAGWRTIIYTGAWFLPYLSVWPNTEYWWAQYPHPDTYLKGTTTWDQLRNDLKVLTVPFNTTAIPGVLKMWQFTGDYLTLPGSTNKIDANVFYGTSEDLAKYFASNPEDSSIPAPDPVVVDTGLYIFSNESYWQRPAGGPLVTPTYDTPKSSGAKDTITPSYWVDRIRFWNKDNPKSFDKLIDPGWGPSKGYNANHKLILVALIYPGRNIVKINKLLIGLDGQQWGEIEYLDANEIPESDVNHINRPDIMHRVYGSNSKWTWHVLSNSPVVPLLSFVKRYVQMKWLIPVKSLLPKTVKINIGLGVNIRESPSVSSLKVTYKLPLQSVTIYEVRIGVGGIWGRCSEGWIALRYNDSNLTDWKI
jgi:GH25 family lysozyme M1 (1,4-beta-N-acetylmuramidase)